MRRTALTTLGPALLALLALPAGAEVSKETLEVALGARQGRDLDRHARVRRRRAERRDRADGLRRARLHPRAQRLQQQLPRRLGAGDEEGLREHRRRGSDDIVIFSELMDSSSLFLTANADTVYYLGWIDLSDGPVVIEQPSSGLGTINDMWFQWVIDIGRPGPDRGLGGKYLIVGPDYDGPLPRGRLFRRPLQDQPACSMPCGPSSRTATIRKPAVENIKQNLKIYPYAAGQLRHAHRRGAGRGGEARRRAEDPRDEVHRGQRHVVQHDPAQRLRLLRDDRRERAERAGDQL